MTPDDDVAARVDGDGMRLVVAPFRARERIPPQLPAIPPRELRDGHGLVAIVCRSRHGDEDVAPAVDRDRIDPRGALKPRLPGDCGLGAGGPQCGEKEQARGGCLGHATSPRLLQ